MMPVGFISTSSPCFLKMHSSTRDHGGGASEFAVQPTL